MAGNEPPRRRGSFELRNGSLEHRKHRKIKLGPLETPCPSYLLAHLPTCRRLIHGCKLLSSESSAQKQPRAKRKQSHRNVLLASLAIQRPCHRAQNPRIPEIRENYEKMHNLGWAWKYEEKTEKYEMDVLSHFYIFDISFVFSGPNPGWGILCFLRNSFVFLGFRGFGLCTMPAELQVYR